MFLIIFKIIIFINFSIYLYNVILSVFSLKKYKAPNIDNAKLTQSFTILIPCHNEENVIFNTLEKIHEIDCPNNLYDVFCILDNCSDNTLLEFKRFKRKYKSSNNINYISLKGGSKPKALNKAISKLKKKNNWNNDNVVILDADNEISKTLLKRFNYYHNNGNSILQARILSANENNIISKGFTSAFNHMAYSFQYARNLVGLSASLSGTGFSINRKVFDEVGFSSCNTLTEDLEFSILCILNGYKIKYIHEDYILNQHLEELKPSITQRIRWCRGHTQVAYKLDSSIIKKFFKKPSWQLIDSFLFVNTPPKFIIYIIANLGLFYYNHYPILTEITLILMIYYLFYILKCNNYKIKYIIPHFLYSITMQVSLFIGTVSFTNKEWVKTNHKKLNK